MDFLGGFREHSLVFTHLTRSSSHLMMMSLSFTHNHINISFGMLGVHRARPSTVSFRFHFPAHCEFFSLDQLSFPSINSTLWRGEHERRATQHPPESREAPTHHTGLKDFPEFTMEI